MKLQSAASSGCSGSGLSQLSERDRLVIVLYFYLDLPLEKVTPIIGSSVGAARARLYRSLRRLRPDLEIQEALK